MNENYLLLSFHYDDASYAIYEQPYIENFTEHEKELFCNNNFNSNFFMKYQILNSESTSKSKYSFPFPTYGLLDNFWKEQTSLQYDDKFYLKIKWIHQLIQGLKDLHSHNYFYGQLSSQCITIDDKKNIKYTFLSDPLKPPEKSTIEETSYFYMPPEYYNKPNDFDFDIQKQQSSDVYALGIIINGIIQETFPCRDDFPSLKKDQLIEMLKNPKENNYPKKKLNDPFWDEFNTQIIDACLKTDKRPSIFDISKNLQQILQEKSINNTYIYDMVPDPIVQSCQDEKYKITSLIKKLVNFNDIATALNTLQSKYGDLSNFFEVELLFASPFKSIIHGFNFEVVFIPKKISDEKYDVVFRSIPDPHFKEYYNDEINEEEYYYHEITSVEYDTMEKEYQESYTICNFFYNKIYFCNMRQFINLYLHNDVIHKITINSEDIISWFIYILEYIIRLEEEQKEKPFLPHNFSSETVLISLLADPKGEWKFQLSIFPFPTKETELSKIYSTDNSDDIDSDIYSFGVLMFEILILYDSNDEQSIGFNSDVMNSLFEKFHNLDTSFNIKKTRKLNNIMTLIENCLTPGKQPSFKEIKSSLCDRQKLIIDLINIYNCIENYEYSLRNQCMNLARLASLCQLFIKDEVHSIISQFVKEKKSPEIDENENEYEYEYEYEGDDEKNPFQKIFLKIVNSEFNEKFVDPFNFILLLKSKDDELSKRNLQNESNSIIYRTINPYLDAIKAIKQKLLITKLEYRNKCLNLKSSKIIFEDMAKSSALTALSLITKSWSPQIPHTLLITIKNSCTENNNNNNNNDNDNDNNGNNNNNDNDDIQNNPFQNKICTLDFLEKFAQENKVKYKILPERNQIKMFFPMKEDIFKELNFGSLGDDILAGYIDNLDTNEEEEDAFIEEEEEDSN